MKATAAVGPHDSERGSSTCCEWPRFGSVTTCVYGRDSGQVREKGASCWCGGSMSDGGKEVTVCAMFLGAFRRCDDRVCLAFRV